MDAIDLILQDHREVDGMFEQFEQLKGDGASADKREVVEKIVRELSVHAAIEEEVLYPVVRDVLPDGNKLVEESLEEHQGAKEALAEIDKTSPDDPAFDAKVTELIADVRHHVEDEESGILPKLREALDDAARHEMGHKLERAKFRAPTRPHPHAPATPPTNKLAGPPAALIDRARDAMEGRESA
ncbi:MAG: hemerythrin domain-containing protein [Actinomycetota bacterium]